MANQLSTCELHRLEWFPVGGISQIRVASGQVYRSYIIIVVLIAVPGLSLVRMEPPLTAQVNLDYTRKQVENEPEGKIQ